MSGEQGTKRKAEEGLPAGLKLPPGLTVSKPEPGPSPVPGPVSVRRESGISAGKKAIKEETGEASHRSKARLTEALKHCNEVLRELFSKKHSGYAWPFYKPVDAETLGRLLSTEISGKTGFFPFDIIYNYYYLL